MTSETGSAARWIRRSRRWSAVWVPVRAFRLPSQARSDRYRSAMLPGRVEHAQSLADRPRCRTVVDLSVLDAGVMDGLVERRNVYTFRSELACMV